MNGMSNSLVGGQAITSKQNIKSIVYENRQKIFVIYDMIKEN